jgi:hypothetical protein
MKVILQFTVREELKALPILLRHSPGMALPGRKYVVSEAAAEALREAGVRFKVLARESEGPSIRGARLHERV